MIPLRLSEIAALTGGRLGEVAAADDDPGDVLVDGPVVTDSREAGPGGLYVARIGERLDGHAFVGAAARAGAVAALTSREVQELPCVVVDDVQEAFTALAAAVVERVPGLQVVGVTGSSGKTTTKDLLADVLAAHAETVANLGSLNSEVGVPLTICRVRPTTAHLVLEMGARGIGHIRYLTDMSHPRVGVVLNVGSAHVGEFGSREAIARAKAELVEALEPGGLAVLNGDDPIVSAMRPGPQVRVVRVGRGALCDVRADEVVLDAGGIPSYRLHTPQGQARVELAVVGEHQVANSLAVVAVALDAGMSLPDVVAALARARPASRWRMERHDRADGVTVLNDAYNANPESMAAALRTLGHVGARRRTWAALGAMRELGASAEADHREVGRLAARLEVDELLVVGSDAAAIFEGARDAGAVLDVTAGSTEATRATRARFAADVDAAYGLLNAELRDGDVVLVKSSRDSGLRDLGDRLVLQEVDR